MKTQFIVFEGLDGSGKSFLIDKVIEDLQKNNLKCLKIHFPNDNIYGGQIKQFLRKEKIFDTSMLLSLFALDRKETLNNISDLQDHDFVFFDRYVYSNIVYLYKLYNHILDFKEFAEFIYKYEFVIHNLPEPNFVFFVDTPPFVCYRKVLERQQIIEFNEEKYEYFKNYYDIYLQFNQLYNLFIVLKNYNHDEDCYVDVNVNIDIIKNVILN